MSWNGEIGNGGLFVLECKNITVVGIRIGDHPRLGNNVTRKFCLFSCGKNNGGRFPMGWE